MRGHLGRQRESLAQTVDLLRQPAHLRAFGFMIVLVLGSFTIAPHFSDFMVYNVGLAKDELAYIYLAGGLVTFVTLPRVGRWADKVGKRLVFRVMAGCTVVAILVLSNLPPAALLTVPSLEKSSVPILVISNLPPVPLLAVLAVTTFYWVVTSGRWVPAMALVTSSALPRYRGSFMSVNASLQQMAMALAAVIAGAVVGETEEGKITGYPTAGLIAAVSTGISMLLAGRLRVAQEVAESSVAVDSPEDSPALTGACSTAPTPSANGNDLKPASEVQSAPKPTYT
jgi:predicted MFS family arabinose efflux permease